MGSGRHPGPTYLPGPGILTKRGPASSHRRGNLGWFEVNLSAGPVRALHNRLRTGPCTSAKRKTSWRILSTSASLALPDFPTTYSRWLGTTSKLTRRNKNLSSHKTSSRLCVSAVISSVSASSSTRIGTAAECSAFRPKSQTEIEHVICPALAVSPR